MRQRIRPAATLANVCLSVCSVAFLIPARTQTRSNTRGSPTKCPSPTSDGNTYGDAIRLGCAAITSAAAAPMGLICGPVFVCGNRT